MAKKLALKSFRLKNFKAIEDSGVVKFTPLTVLIGDNGSGKSSLIEGLQTYQAIVKDGLDAAMGMWRGIEHVTNPPFNYIDRKIAHLDEVNVLEFTLRGQTQLGAFQIQSSISPNPNSDGLSFERETLHLRNRKILERDKDGSIATNHPNWPFKWLDPGISVHSVKISFDHIASDVDLSTIQKRFDLNGFASDWQFLALDAWGMGEPRPIQRTGGSIRLRSDGANIAEYLNEIRERDPDAFDGIIDSMQFVMPYMHDIKPVLTDFLGRQMHLTMKEDDFTVPGWLLSTGTLRILALLALFRHPNPPPVIVIEELENGLDPRCIHLIVEEIRNVVESGRSQVIVTTHSPYLLDLLPLWSIVLVERGDGPPTFTRPGDREEVVEWAKKFSPGRLYTMEALSSREE